MTSTTPPTWQHHPITWTDESSFNVPIRATNDVPIGKMFEDLHPKWLDGRVDLEKAINQACQGFKPDISLQWAKNSLRQHQNEKVWLAQTLEDRTSALCTTWLNGLNKPRKLQRYRTRSV